MEVERDEYELTPKLHQGTSDQRLANEHLSNERTFLAWMSASVAIMAFGFVVVKFALFARHFAPVLDMPPVEVNDYSALLGIGLVSVGALGILLSLFRFRATATQLRNGNFVHSGMSITLIAVILFAISLALVGYLAMAAME